MFWRLPNTSCPPNTTNTTASNTTYPPNATNTTASNTTFPANTTHTTASNTSSPAPPSPSSLLRQQTAARWVCLWAHVGLPVKHVLGHPTDLHRA